MADRALSLREALRAFARQKSIFVVAVLTLSLGLGLCTTMFCILYGVIVRPLSYGDPRRLMMAWAGYESGASERDTFGEQAIVEWRQTARSLRRGGGLPVYDVHPASAGRSHHLEGAMVSPGVLLGILSCRSA